MIQPHEIRIGNTLCHRVLPNGEKIHHTVTPNCIEWICDDVESFNVAYVSVFLTPEILEKYGFARYPWGIVKDGVLFNDKGTKCKILYLELGNGKTIEINSLHQLQNVWCDIQKEELK